jgi:hypothetical protein
MSAAAAVKPGAAAAHAVSRLHTPCADDSALARPLLSRARPANVHGIVAADQLEVASARLQAVDEHARRAPPGGVTGSHAPPSVPVLISKLRPAAAGPLSVNMS